MVIHADPQPATAHLIELFLPLYDNDGNTFPKPWVDRVREELVERFGGVTAFVRSPAVGLWEDDDGEVSRDDVVLFEIMTGALDRDWWAQYRRQLEQRFSQDEVLIRVTRVERL